MPTPRVVATGKPNLEGLADVLTISEAAAACGVSDHTIRQARKNGELEAFTPGNRDPRKAGRGLGYRIHKAELQRWFLGEEKPDAT